MGQLSNMESNYEKKLAHVSRGASGMKTVDTTTAPAGLDTMAEDLDALKYDVGELKDLLNNNKGEINHVRRIVLACERDMEDFTAAMDAVNVDLDEMRARVETNLEEAKAKIVSDTDQAVNALNGRIDFTNKDLAATQESLHTTQNSLSDCFNEVAVVRSDLERNIADTEARLKNDIRQKQQEAFEKIGAVEQQAELRSAEASRRLGALDLRMSGVQGGLGEHKRDILKLREEVNGLTVKSASHEVDIQKNSDAVRKMEKQRNMDEQNWKAQMDAVHDVLDTKVNEKPFEDLKHCVASLTKGTVKFAQVVGVFPGPRFDDADGLDQSEADVELLGWEECAENMSFRVDKAWRQRCSQRFRNILDMIAKKADHSVLRLLQISQQHIESQLERVKHERELWKEVVERRQQQPLQLALSMKEQPGDTAALTGFASYLMNNFPLRPAAKFVPVNCKCNNGRRL